MSHLTPHIKRKKSNLKRSKNLRPNYRLYITLLIFFGIVSLCAVLVECFGKKHNNSSFIYSSLISIMGGAFASSLVSMLVDRTQCRINNKKSSNIRNHELLELRMFMSVFMCDISNEVALADDSQNGNAMSFAQWIGKFIDLTPKYKSSKIVACVLT